MKSVVLTGSLLLSLGLGACGAAPAKDEAAPAAPVSAPAPAPAQPTAETPPPADSDNQYLIGPGDTLQVFVWRNPELTTTVPVRPDGMISTPLVENMKAVGKTPSQLARDMEKVLGELVRDPRINIIVTTPLGALSQIKVVGQVKEPKALPYREGMTVLEVVMAVGGLAEFGSGNRAKIVRTSKDGKHEEIKVKLNDLLNKGDMRQNLSMKPGDVLIVPQSLF